MPTDKPLVSPCYRIIENVKEGDTIPFPLYVREANDGESGWGDWKPSDTYFPKEQQRFTKADAIVSNSALVQFLCIAPENCSFLMLQAIRGSVPPVGTIVLDLREPVEDMQWRLETRATFDASSQELCKNCAKVWKYPVIGGK